MARKAKLAAADGIRGLACLIVLILHASVFFFPESFPYIKGVPKSGVWLFFVLSAFLLTLKLIRSDQNIQSIIEYGIGRFLRIIPLFLAAVVAYAYFGQISWKQAQDATLFSAPVIHFWTIAVEFKFYIALPLLAFSLISIDQWTGTKGVILFTAGFTLIHQAFFPYWEIEPSSVETSWYLPTFLFGCAGALIYSRGDHRYLEKYSVRFGASVLLVMTLSSPAARNYLFNAPLSDDLVNKHIHLGFLWTVFILAIVSGQGTLGRILSSAPISVIGKWSYSIYLFHLLFILKLSALHKESITWMLASIAISIAVGAASHLIIERPITLLRGKMAFNGSESSSTSKLPS